MPPTKKKKGGASSQRKPTIEELCQSDDSSDDDDLLNGPLPFSQRSPSVSSNSNRSNDGNDGDGDPAPPAAPSPSTSVQERQQALEEQKRELVNSKPDLYVNFLAKNISSVDQLQWHSKPKKNSKQIECYPCRLISDDEAHLLLLGKYDPNNKRKEAVQYLSDNLAAIVATSQLKPLLVVMTDNEEDTRDEPNISPQHMDDYMKTLEHKKKSMEDRALEKAKLEGIVAKCVEEAKQKAAKGKGKPKPKENQKKPEEEEEDHDEEDDDDEEEDEDEPVSFSQLMEQETELEKQQEEESNDPKPAVAATSTKPQRDSLSSFDPNKKEPKQTLREGCVVEYYHPNSVAGLDLIPPTTIFRVYPKENNFQLQLANGENLRSEDLVRLVQKMHRGKLQVNDKPKMQRVVEYRLVRSKEGAKSNELDPMMKKANLITEKIREQNERMANDPEMAMFSDIMHQPSTSTSNSSSNKNKKRRAPVETAAASTEDDMVDMTDVTTGSKPKKRKLNAVTVSTNNTESANVEGAQVEARFAIPEKWWKETSKKEIDDQIELNQKAAKATSSRRGAKGSHMLTEHLTLILQVRERLYCLVKDSNGEHSATSVLESIVSNYEAVHKEECPFGESQLSNFLMADKHKLLREKDYSAIAEELKKWLESVGPVDDKQEEEEEEGNSEDNKSSTANKPNQAQIGECEPETMQDVHESHRKPVAQKKESKTIPKKEAKISSKKASAPKKRRASVDSAPTSIEPLSSRKSRRKTIYAVSSEAKLRSKDDVDVVFQETMVGENSKPSEWQVGTAELVEETKKLEAAQSSGTSRRRKVSSYNKMTIEQLKVAIKARVKVQRIMEDSNGETTLSKVLHDIIAGEETDGLTADDLEQLLERFVSGNKHKFLRERDVEAACAKMNKWLSSDVDARPGMGSNSVADPAANLSPIPESTSPAVELGATETKETAGAAPSSDEETPNPPANLDTIHQSTSPTAEPTATETKNTATAPSIDKQIVPTSVADTPANLGPIQETAPPEVEAARAAPGTQGVSSCVVSPSTHLSTSHKSTSPEVELRATCIEAKESTDAAAPGSDDAADDGKKAHAMALNNLKQFLAVSSSSPMEEAEESADAAPTSDDPVDDGKKAQATALNDLKQFLAVSSSRPMESDPDTGAKDQEGTNTTSAAAKAELKGVDEATPMTDISQASSLLGTAAMGAQRQPTALTKNNTNPASSVRSVFGGPRPRVKKPVSNLKPFSMNGKSSKRAATKDPSARGVKKQPIEETMVEATSTAMEPNKNEAEGDADEMADAVDHLGESNDDNGGGLSSISDEIENRPPDASPGERLPKSLEKRPVIEAQAAGQSENLAPASETGSTEVPPEEKSMTNVQEKDQTVQPASKEESGDDDKAVGNPKEEDNTAQAASSSGPEICGKEHQQPLVFSDGSRALVLK